MKTYKQNETPEFEMIRAAAPEEEGARQYYFIEEAKILWKQQFESMVDSGEAAERYEGSLLSELQAEGRYGTFHISTFGCQMNARDSEKLCGILEADRLDRSRDPRMQTWCFTTPVPCVTTQTRRYMAVLAI